MLLNCTLLQYKTIKRLFCLFFCFFSLSFLEVELWFYIWPQNSLVVVRNCEWRVLEMAFSRVNFLLSRKCHYMHTIFVGKRRRLDEVKKMRCILDLFIYSFIYFSNFSLGKDGGSLVVQNGIFFQYAIANRRREYKQIIPLQFQDILFSYRKTKTTYPKNQNDKSFSVVSCSQICMSSQWEKLLSQVPSPKSQPSHPPPH